MVPLFGQFGCEVLIADVVMPSFCLTPYGGMLQHGQAWIRPLTSVAVLPARLKYEPASGVLEARYVADLGGECHPNHQIYPSERLQAPDQGLE